ncbi:MAG: AAA family ATPase, partial [Ignavibacteriota bacterium]
MRALSLDLSNFRSHISTSVAEFAEGINVISGPNGAGKTSILEAISVAALTRSFTESPDNTLVRTGSSGFTVNALFSSDLGVQFHARTDYT